MFNKVFKLILCIAIFGFSIQQFIGDNIGNGIALIFLSLTFLLLYFKNEILIIAFLRMRKQDFEGTEKWLEINTKYSEIWPNINKKKDPPADHKKFENEENKFEKYFKENL